MGWENSSIGIDTLNITACDVNSSIVLCGSSGWNAVVNNWSANVTFPFFNYSLGVNNSFETCMFSGMLIWNMDLLREAILIIVKRKSVQSCEYYMTGVTDTKYSNTGNSVSALAIDPDPEYSNYIYAGTTNETTFFYDLLIKELAGLRILMSKEKHSLVATKNTRRFTFPQTFLFAGCEGLGVYKSSNAGSDWFSTSLTGKTIGALDASPYTFVNIFAGGERKITIRFGNQQMQTIGKRF